MIFTNLDQNGKTGRESGERKEHGCLRTAMHLTSYDDWSSQQIILGAFVFRGGERAWGNCRSEKHRAFTADDLLTIGEKIQHLYAS